MPFYVRAELFFTIHKKSDSQKNLSMRNTAAEIVIIKHEFVATAYSLNLKVYSKVEQRLLREKFAELKKAQIYYEFMLNLPQIVYLCAKRIEIILR